MTNHAPEQFDGLYQLLEESVEIDTRARASARERMLTVAARRDLPAAGAGDSELVRLADEHIEQTFMRGSRRLIAIAAALVIALAGAATVASLRIDRSAAPAATPTPAPPSAERASPFAVGAAAGTGLHTIELKQWSFQFELSHDYIVVDREDHFVILELSGAPDVGKLMIAAEPAYAIGSDASSWIAMTGVNRQLSVTEMFGESVPIFSIFASDGADRCTVDGCPLFERPDGTPLLQAATGAATRLIEGDVDGQRIVVAATDRSEAMTLQDAASTIARSLTVTDRP